jgi:hypothetical protein
MGADPLPISGYPRGIYQTPVFGTLVALLTGCFLLVSCLAFSSAVRMEAVRFSETSLDFYQTKLHYIPEDSILLHLYGLFQVVPPSTYCHLNPFRSFGGCVFLESDATARQSYHFMRLIEKKHKQRIGVPDTSRHVAGKFPDHI